MAKSDMPVPRRWRGLTVHARGHFLLFDQRSAFHWNAETGARLLFTVVAIEAIRIVAIEWLHPVLPDPCPAPPSRCVGIGSVSPAARSCADRIMSVELAAVERSYFVQPPIANVVFPLVFANRLRLILTQPSIVATVWSAFVPYLFFGFYQEVVYRGILQPELVRRWGALTGILSANVFYTFGPLHWYYFAAQASLAVPMFAAIFAIGLFFGVLFWRSGNLWIVAVIHGIGNAYIVGSPSARDLRQ
jgi:hypothetical protein